MIISILKDLFVNMCILITIVFVGSQIFMKEGLYPSAGVKTKVELGILTGLLGIILMIFSIKIPPGALVDLRNIALIISTVYGGDISALVTGILLTAFRLFYPSLSITSATGAAVLLFLMLGCILISKLHLKKRKQWLYLFLYSDIMAIIGFMLTIENHEILPSIIASYLVGAASATILSYFLTDHLIKNYLLLKQLKRESSVDFLTGLQNTRSFNALYDTVLQQSISRNEKVSLLALDLDLFKTVNDTYGHAAGDAVLRELGEVLSKQIRSFDIVARIGGEEFCVILKNCSQEETLETAERIRNAVENHLFYLPCGNSINITISIGCAIYPDTIRHSGKIKKTADMKLYEAKGAGRNKVCI